MRKAAIVFLLLTLTLIAQRRKRDDAEGFFHTEVPAHRYDLTLGRVDANSVTATILAYEPLEGYIVVGSRQTPLRVFSPGEPAHIILDKLAPDARHAYRFHYRKPGETKFEQSPESAFHTQHKPGSAFTFAVQADAHLDENTSPESYRQTLANIRQAQPDFLIDLGDTFMTDKRRGDFRQALPQYVAQRYYFSLAATPLFLVLGNHDGEDGSRHEMSEWSLQQRTRYFANPRTASERENYYAFTWGDALFIALDPYTYTTSRRRGDLWRWTLGKTQYDWMRQTLEKSKASFKFVFIHHPIGANSEPTRGGIAAAKYGEWGGRDADGKDRFAQERPGWSEPIHRLLVKHGVNIVFHGHDHFYAREELDGVVYQLVPQPGNPRALQAPRNAEEYGYHTGAILGGAGYVRVTVSSNEITADYVTPSKDTKHSYRMLQTSNR